MAMQDSSVQLYWDKWQNLHQNRPDVLLYCSSEAYISSAVKSCVRRHYSCHELFGFDILLDDKLKPWILEVNISPR